VPAIELDFGDRQDMVQEQVSTPGVFVPGENERTIPVLSLLDPTDREVRLILGPVAKATRVV
jgi:hypothetical protein